MMAIKVCFWVLVLPIVTASSKCPTDYCQERPNGDYKNPGESDQHFFISCSEGRTLCMPCAATLTFNDELKKCVPEGDPTTPTPTDGPRSTTPSAYSTGGSHTTTGSSSPHCAQNACDGLGDGKYENREPYSKEYYSKCTNGNLICQQCPNGMIFTDANKGCHSPSHCDLCKDKGPISSITTSKTTTTVSTVTTTNFLDPSCPGKCKS